MKKTFNFLGSLLLFATIVTSCEKNNEQNYPFLLNSSYV